MNETGPDRATERRTLQLRIAELVEANADTSTWGAANAARFEHINELRGALRQLNTDALAEATPASNPEGLILRFPADDYLWKAIPSYMHDAILRYLNFGYASGDFLMSVFRNNLGEALMRADSENRYVLKDYIYLLQNVAPGIAWGTEERVRKWVEIGGLLGFRITKASSPASEPSASSSSSSQSS